MFNKALLRQEVVEFIREHEKSDLPKLVLKGSPFKDVSIQELASQVKGLQVARKKFPEFYNSDSIIYPHSLNLEQSSSEKTAAYKASLVEGKTGIDLTGGLGIDSYHLSEKFEDFTYCEMNPELAEIVQHNFESLNSGISVEIKDSIEYLQNNTYKKYDWIYADPARRGKGGGKVFRLQDCEPNIPQHLALIFSKTERLLLKTSPILDISAGIQELRFVKEIHILAVRNEVKELLWILEKDYIGEIKIHTVNFEKEHEQIFSGSYHSEAEAEFSEPLTYLYEPNSAIMKSGLFDLLAEKTQTNKLHPHSHLYTSERLIDFPGRRFKVVDVLDFKSTQLKSYLKSKKANISTRNFPESVENLRKKFKVKEGGKDYVFFSTKLREEKIAIICEKV
ncbi:class I SAM-dependent methyltransferase [Gramella sp. BOM4]|nr:class I SAM-dependent methyltransferase [Christiangramia bathymodioli]